MLAENSLRLLRLEITLVRKKPKTQTPNPDHTLNHNCMMLCYIKCICISMSLATSRTFIQIRSKTKVYSKKSYLFHEVIQWITLSFGLNHV